MRGKVSQRLLDLCAGSDLDKQRIAQKDVSRVESVVREKDGMEVEAKEWLKLKKKNLQG